MKNLSNPKPWAFNNKDNIHTAEKSNIGFFKWYLLLLFISWFLSLLKNQTVIKLNNKMSFTENETPFENCILPISASGKKIINNMNIAFNIATFFLSVNIILFLSNYYNILVSS